MTADQMIALGSAAIALVSMVVTIWFSVKSSHSSQKSLLYSEQANEHAKAANAFANRANEISIGQTETALREQITSARQRMEELNYKMRDILRGRDRSQLSDEENNHIDSLEPSWNSTVENYLNAYEDACGKYLDNKTDRQRFKKMYIREIRNICDPHRKAYERHMHPESTSHFEAIWKVYKEWNRYEE